ncbi:MAG: TIGR04076 family protein [Firmicutes bacterium]|nr:TIGR04076 family protein [Bacillota bacterium]MCM1402113.1 TIGR04076 family protein [Bacteroides sp.]
MKFQKKADISRRRFCKFSLLGSLAAIMIPRRAFGAVCGVASPMGGRCRVEIIRCQCFEELQGRYLNDPEAGPCSRYKVGDVVQISPGNFQETKERFCPNAWRVLEPYVLAALRSGATKECAPAEESTQAIVSCPDGTRPVIFKVTAL